MIESNMSIQFLLSIELLCTIGTNVFFSFMDRFNMNLQATFQTMWIFTKFTLIPRLFNSLMNILYMIVNSWYTAESLITYVTNLRYPFLGNFSLVFMSQFSMLVLFSLLLMTELHIFKTKFPELFKSSTAQLDNYLLHRIKVIHDS